MPVLLCVLSHVAKRYTSLDHKGKLSRKAKYSARPILNSSSVGNFELSKFRLSVMIAHLVMFFLPLLDRSWFALSLASISYDTVIFIVHLLFKRSEMCVP